MRPLFRERQQASQAVAQVEANDVDLVKVLRSADHAVYQCQRHFVERMNHYTRHPGRG